MEAAETSAQAATARIVADAPVRLWGMTSRERLTRSLRRAGVAVEDAAAPLVVSAAWVLDDALVKAVAARPGAALVAPDGELVAVHLPAPDPGAAAAVSAGDAARLPEGVARLGAADLVPAYNAALRKRAEPLLRKLTPEALPEIERRMFAGSYKGVTDLVTKYVWPVPALVVTRWCAKAGLTPNQVTFAGFLLVIAAFAAFWTGQFAWGLVAAWIMTFLDTVDGKLARVTLTSSKFGNAFDHGIDLIHPPFWWWAWIVGLGAAGWSLPHPELVLAVTVGGYVLQRIEEGVFLACFRIEIHMWRPFDSGFRLITTRRNPNLILLTVAVLGRRPDLGALAVAGWTAVSVAVHAVRILQAFAARRGGPLTSWMAEAERDIAPAPPR